MCDIKNMSSEELRSLSDRIAVELKDRKNKEQSALLTTLRDTIERLHTIDPTFYINGYVRTDCCNERMEIDIFGLLLSYFDI